MLFESLSILCVCNNSRISFYTLILAFRFLHRSHFVLPIIQALDYLLCYYLLNENLNSFKNTFDTYYKRKFEVVPRLYEEALVQVLSKSSDEEVDGYQIPQDVIEDYQDYIHCKSGRKAKEELRERYSSTYWYYSDYIH